MSVSVKNEQLSKTMRIDLIPTAPSEPVSGTTKRVVVSSVTRKRRSTSETARIVDDTPYQRLLQGVYDAALITDLDGRIVDVNVRAVEFLHYDRSDLLSAMIFDIISGADSSLIQTLWQNLEDERFTLIQAYCVREDGSMFPAEIAVNKLLLGKMHLCFFIRDITWRRQAEEMLRIEHSAIQNSGNGIAVANLDVQLEYANPAAAQMWRYNVPDDLIGVNVRDLLCDTAAADTMIRRLMDSGKSWTGEAKAKRRDGSEFDVQIAAACNRNADGELDGIVLSFVDISDRKRAVEAERELERRRVMLESLGAACHHLGQPATILMGNLGMIRKGTAGSDETVRRLVEASIDATQELGRILHKLNAVNEYKTMQYLGRDDSGTGEEHRILDI
jgi:PAS domain S-box-containing protein